MCGKPIFTEPQLTSPPVICLCTINARVLFAKRSEILVLDEENNTFFVPTKNVYSRRLYPRAPDDVFWAFGHQDGKHLWL